MRQGKQRQAQSSSARSHERRIVRRTRLLERLTAAEARTILLTAPAGYGKTTLARQWLEDAGGAWLSVTSASCDIPVLARDLGAAIGEIVPIDLRRVETALKAARAPLEQARGVARVILGQVAAPVQGWLIVDDYHLLMTSPAAEELIGTLERSGRFRLLCTTRERPSWATSRRRVYLDLLEIGAGELALDDHEVAELLPPSRRTAALRRQAHGWPAVIALASYSESSDVPLSVDALSATLYDYFAEELYERAPPGVQRTLTEIALLPPLESEELAEFLQEKATATPVLATGLAYESDGRIEIHPLARAFLLTKVRAREDWRAAVTKSIDLAIEKRRWDEAFDLVAEFDFDDRLEGLITMAFSPLIETGRIATLDAFGRFAAGKGCLPHQLLDLISAEVALREGALNRAFELGRSAVHSWSDQHPLKPRGLVVSGVAAQLSYQLDEALELHTRAKRLAVRQSDINDSTWGRCLAALVLEHESMRDAVRELEAIATPRPEDRLRVLVARQILGRLTEGFRDLGSETAAAEHLLAMVADPWVRTGWGNMQGYLLALHGRYDDARNVLIDTLDDAADSGLTFARPHVESSLALAELGLRHFSRCESLLRRVERHLDQTADLHLLLNARALRARLHLAQQRFDDALEVTCDEFETIPNRAIYGEYVATRALALAAGGYGDEALTFAERAREVTGGVEARVLSAATWAVVSLGGRNADSAAQALLETAERLNVWDGVVCAARAVPSLAVQLAGFPHQRPRLHSLFTRSNDASLIKLAALGHRPLRTRGTLSPREREVLDLVAIGLRNAEIAAALFISASTVKVHVRHICEKLGARTRAEAVARYAEIETAGSEKS